MVRDGASDEVIAGDMHAGVSAAGGGGDVGGGMWRKCEDLEVSKLV